MELKFKHFVILQALDVLTTYIGLTYMHLREANTFALGIFQEYGLITGLIALKIAGLMIIYLLLYVMPLKIKIKDAYINLTPFLIKTGCFIFIIVVLNNSYQMIRVI